MSKLRQKSDFNIDAAEHLLSKEYYASSVHCSYYSCFQLLKYTIKEFSGIYYETQAQNASSSGQKTHQYVINHITGEINSHVGFEESRKFKRTINDLKVFRLESDYEDVEVNLDKSEKALCIAKEIRKYIINNFHV